MIRVKTEYCGAEWYVVVDRIKSVLSVQNLLKRGVLTYIAILAIVTLCSSTIMHHVYKEMQFHSNILIQ